jgi:hypothetical protein
VSEEQVVKYDEMGVMDGGTIGLPRKMTREIWLEEVFPEWGAFLNREIETFDVKPGTGVLWSFGGPSTPGRAFSRTIPTAVCAAPVAQTSCGGCA